MRFDVEPRIFSEFPGARVGVVVGRGLDNRGDGTEIRCLLAEEERRVAADLAGVAIADHPRIAPWRDAYRRFGAKPKTCRSSIENLLRRVLKRDPLPSINPLVDLYNLVSLRHLLPVGGESLEQIRGSIKLTFAGEAEAEVLLLGERQARAPHLGEVIYKDDAGAICRRWNWKEAERTKLTAETRDAVLVIEALPPAGEALLEAALADLASLVDRFCGGSGRPGRLACYQLHEHRSNIDLDEEAPS